MWLAVVDPSGVRLQSGSDGETDDKVGREYPHQQGEHQSGEAREADKYVHDDTVGLAASNPFDSIRFGIFGCVS